MSPSHEPLGGMFVIVVENTSLPSGHGLSAVNVEQHANISCIAPLTHTHTVSTWSQAKQELTVTAIGSSVKIGKSGVWVM